MNMAYIFIDPKYTKVQNEFLEAFHEAHTLWLSLLESNFSQKLEEILRATKWDNGCASAWESKHTK